MSGLPKGVQADIRVNGTGEAHDYSLSGSDTRSVAPGNYLITVGVVVHGEYRYMGATDSVVVTATQGKDTRSNAEYRVSLYKAARVAPSGADSPIEQVTETSVTLGHSAYTDRLKPGQILVSAATEAQPTPFAAVATATAENNVAWLKFTGSTDFHRCRRHTPRSALRTHPLKEGLPMKRRAARAAAAAALTLGVLTACGGADEDGTGGGGEAGQATGGTGGSDPESSERPLELVKADTTAEVAAIIKKVFGPCIQMHPDDHPMPSSKESNTCVYEDGSSVASLQIHLIDNEERERLHLEADSVSYLLYA